MDAAPTLLIFCPLARGGIPDYAHRQAISLSAAGWRVRLLCPPGYPHTSTCYEIDPTLPEEGKPSPSRWRRIIRMVRSILAGVRTLDRRIAESGTQVVLLATYSEYLAPLWAWRLRRRRRSGVTFGAVVHDPVRDFVVGPPRWHRWSISEGYSFLDHAFVHEPIDLDTGNPRRTLALHVIPHGPYAFPDGGESRDAVRERLGIPADARLFLSFGHLRDGKNLKLVLQALRGTPSAWLLVSGSEAGTGHISSTRYREMAVALGVADRCRWVIGFATEPEAAGFFAAADVVLLTYQASFRSASGVLNLAVHFRKPVLVSCGESNLASSVACYQLGIRVAADDADEIQRGLIAMEGSLPSARWDDYEQDNSWERNAAIVTEAFRSGA